MDFEFLANLGWREGLMAIVGLLTVYLVTIYWRMRRLKRVESRSKAEPLSFSFNSAVAAYSAEQSSEQKENQASSEQPGELGTPEYQFPWNEPPAATPQEQRIAALEIEIDQLRREVGGLRAEVLVLREATQRHEVTAKEEPRVSVEQLIAPQYSEAMQMAMKNVDAMTISQQCGISRAEAELVAALARNSDN